MPLRLGHQTARIRHKLVMDGMLSFEIKCSYRFDDLHLANLTEHRAGAKFDFHGVDVRYYNGFHDLVIHSKP